MKLQGVILKPKISQKRSMPGRPSKRLLAFSGDGSEAFLQGIETLWSSGNLHSRVLPDNPHRQSLPSSQALLSLIESTQELFSLRARFRARLGWL